ncbi:GNAT family N-acetyltransferase [Candidatus Woesearchaeota archaeon]|nr:GNAT family N-acetyltransferase [Candidatus Woesearchaeota archaeon]
MELRQARIDDVDSMNELFLLAIKRKEFPESLEEAKEIAKKGREEFGKSGIRIFVASDKRGVIGYIRYGSYEQFGNKHKAVLDTYDTKDCAYIQAFVVHPDYRRQGITRRLVELVLKDAKEQGYKGIYCTASADNIPSRKFQESCGFKELVLFKDPKRKGGDTTALFYQAF